MSDSALYISTRGGIAPVSFHDAVLMGLATDGGLLLPRQIPDVRDEMDAWRSLDYPELAAAVMRPFVGACLSAAVLDRLVSRSYATFTDAAVVPVRRVGSLHIAELFHGPTLAFKDIALQFLGNLFEEILGRTGEGLNILGATSGDTGSAAIAGVRGRRNISIFIMHPHGRVSAIQERQMTTVLDSNVHNIAIEGTFDDGQRVLKEIFNDIPFKQAYRLGAVNSVNWARVLAQVVYYFHAAFRVQEACGAEAIQVSVPTGNFGDIFAGYIAQRMGAPIRRLILATNENDILARFFTSGVYARSSVRQTTSPSMDIQVASNFERYLYYRTGENAAAVAELMARFSQSGRIEVEGSEPLIQAGSGNVSETADTIRRYYEHYGYLLDPHTAVGVTVAERHLVDGCPTVCLATAHPAKFPETIREAVGRDVAHHPAIERLRDLPVRCSVQPATREAVESLIRDRVAAVRVS